MNFETIETRRLVLKGLFPNDMNYIFEKMPKPDIMRLLGHRSEEDFLKEETKYKFGYSSYNRSFLLFLMIDKAADCIIGRCGFHNWNIEHHRSEIGYVIEDENFKRKGLMTEAVAALIDYGFDKMNLNRIEALVGSENTPSLKLMKKFKFKKEGVLRQHFKTLENYEDSILFSIIRLEYI